jgi:hypothetical protein
MCIYNRLKKIQQCIKEEENACQVLGAVAIHSLCRSFDVAVENKRGVNLELIYNEISGDKDSVKKRRKRKKNKKQNVVDDDQDSYNCEPEPVPEKLIGSCDTWHHFADDFEPIHSDDNEEDDEGKIILCDGTIIDAVDAVSADMNTSKINVHGTEFEHCMKTVRSRSVSTENLDQKIDAISVISCHSCHNDGECAQRSIDAGYSSETPNEGLLCNNSRTSSIVSTPEGSEVACNEACCNKTLSTLNETYLTLEQMLVSSTLNIQLFCQ